MTKPSSPPNGKVRFRQFGDVLGERVMYLLSLAEWVLISLFPAMSSSCAGAGEGAGAADERRCSLTMSSSSELVGFEGWREWLV